MIHADEILRKGGEFLGAARAWIQRKKLNGSRVTWGSNETLEPPVTVAEIEIVAAYAAAAERDRCIQIVESTLAIQGHVKEEILKRLGKV